jgi:protein-S-isoprenylcysteine O-methyltransferase Ste14
MPHRELLQWSGWVIAAAWLVWLAIWIAASLGTKPTARRESPGSRLAYLAPILLSAFLLLLAKRTHIGTALAASGPPLSWLYVRFVPLYVGVVWIGAPLVVLGVLIALWARFHLGRNWSGSVTVKQDHELVVTGPYRFVRHPIYTGLLLAVAGSACAIGQLRGLLALALTLFALWYKSRTEEHMMIETFGEKYIRYREAVKALIPFVL